MRWLRNIVGVHLAWCQVHQRWTFHDWGGLCRRCIREMRQWADSI